MSSIEDLREKIRAYSRAYYGHRLLRGLILWLALSLATVIFYLVMEHLGRFASNTRQVLFWSFAGLFIFWLGYYVLIPALRIANLLRGLEEEEVAEHINQLEPGLRNKLLNTLSLSRDAASELHHAALTQKIAQLAPYDFTAVLNFRALRPLLMWAVVPMFFLLAMFTIDKEGRWSESGKRLVYYNQDFRPPAPFQFLVEGNSFVIARGDRLSVDLRLTGEEIPQQVTAVFGERVKLPQKLGLRNWRLELDNLQEDGILTFEANGYKSASIEVRIYDRPSVGAWDLTVVPPDYTGIKQSTEALSGMHRIPEGSSFSINAKNARAVDCIFLSNGDGQTLPFVGAVFKDQLLKNRSISISIANKRDSIGLFDGSRLVVIKDERPEISIIKNDSIGELTRSFTLKASDDYGLSKLERILWYGSISKSTILKIPKGIVEDRFAIDERFAYDKQVFVQYKVWDNDGINGAKWTITGKEELTHLSKEEKEERAYEKLESFSRGSKTRANQVDQFNKELMEMENSTVNQSRLDWKDKNDLKDKLTELKQNRAKRFKEREDLQQDLKALEADSALKKELNERLKEMNAKEQELMLLEQELQALMERLNMKDLKQKLEKLQQENKQQLRQEQRMDDLLEDLLFQRDLLQNAEKLKSLSEKMDELSKRKESAEELQTSQEEFKEAMDDLEGLQEKSDELKDLMNSEKMEQLESDVQTELQDAKESMESGEQRESDQLEQKASEKLEEMSEALSSMMMDMQSKALAMNIESLRKILENLKGFSLEVEHEGKRISALGKDDPNFRSVLQQQRRLLAGAKVIEDSLTVLATKAPQIQEKVFDELVIMMGNLEEARNVLQNQDYGKARVGHQYSMMAANELALLLDNSLQSMMSMMAQQKPGEQNCQKPGGAKPKPGAKGQKASKLGEMVGKLDKGEKSGKGKEGKSKEMGRILSEQEALRQMIQQADEGEKGSGGNGDKENLADLDQMEGLLLEERFTEYLERLKRVETRLLENEKAREERKQKEERQSSTGSKVGMLEGEQLGEQQEQTTSSEAYLRSQFRLNSFYLYLSNGSN